MNTRATGRPIKITKAVGDWNEMEFDAFLTRNGIRWLRVKDGMGGRGDREDWVADLPGGAVSVHDYEFKPPYWGQHRFKNIGEAMDAALARNIQHQKHRIEEMRENIEKLSSSIASMEKAVAP